MRCKYTAAMGKGSGGPFPALLTAAYGLYHSTVETVYCEGQLLARPRPKTLPTGSGRDESLRELAEKLRRKAGNTHSHTWTVRGYFRFDGSPRQAHWLQHYAIPHAESYQVALAIPAFDAWMAADGEGRIARFKKRERRHAAPVRQPRNDIRPLDIYTQVRRRPDLSMLTYEQYPARYCPKTDIEEMRTVLVAQTQNAHITIGRGFGSPHHGHVAALWVDEQFWMSTSPRERLMAARDARQCPPGADAFVGGLGLGLIVLYLAHRCRRITVCELDERVIRLVWPRLTAYIQPRFPDLKLRVFLGNALDIVAREPGRYQFIYFDIWPKPPSAEEINQVREITDTAQPQAMTLCWAAETN